MKRDLRSAELSGFAKKSLVPSPVAKMTGEFAKIFRDGIDINLGVGYVNEETIPSVELVQAMKYVCEHPEEHRMPLNYGGPEGSPNLIAAVKRFISRSDTGLTNVRLEELRLVIGANGATSILDSLGDIFEPGIVVTADPYYYIYCETLERKGFDIRTVEEGRDGLEPEQLRNFLWALTDSELESLKFLYVVTVNNPSGSVISYENRLRIIDVAIGISEKLGREIPLIFDCAYDSLNHGDSCPEIRSVLTENYSIPVYEISTFSKIIAPALRIGYIIGKDSNIIDAVVQKTADIGFSNSLVMQEATAWILDNVVDEQIDTVNLSYHKKAVAIKREIENDLSPWLEAVSGGESGFYFYLTFKDIQTGKGSKFYAYLSRSTGIAKYDLVDMEGDKLPVVVYIPGEICQNPHGSSSEKGLRQLRISYGFEDTVVVRKAIAFMKEACEYACR